MHTRRRFLLASVGSAASVLVARPSWSAQAASAAPPTREVEEVYVGELRLFAGDFVPRGWLGCSGEEVAVEDYPELANAIGGAFGPAVPGHFRLPDLRGRAVAGDENGAGLPPYQVGAYGQALAARGPDNLPATLALTYLISPRTQAHPALVGEVRAFPFDFAPRGWAVCDGLELPIVRHTTLFLLIGPRFGGDGSKTFALPDLRSRTPLSHGDGPSLPPAPIGSRGDDLAPAGPARRPRLHVNFCIAIEGQVPFTR